MIAVVTGANRVNGIGYECVKALLAADPSMRVVLTSRDAAAGRSAAESLHDERVTAQQLDITDEASVTALASSLDSIDVLINNAGFSFPMETETPFSEQARITIDINYYGTQRMIETLAPRLTPKARVIGVSSTSGALANWSESKRERLLAADTVEALDAIAEEFVAAAKNGEHKTRGFPGSAYGTSKALMTQLHRVLAASTHPSPRLVVACCPGLCRTDMATGRGTWMSNILWAASFLIGHSASGGADTPVWLATLPESERAAYHGKFVRSREVQGY